MQAGIWIGPTGDRQTMTGTLTCSRGFDISSRCLHRDFVVTISVVGLIAIRSGGRDSVSVTSPRAHCGACEVMESGECRHGKNVQSATGDCFELVRRWVAIVHEGRHVQMHGLEGRTCDDSVRIHEEICHVGHAVAGNTSTWFIHVDLLLVHTGTF